MIRLRRLKQGWFTGLLLSILLLSACDSSEDEKLTRYIKRIKNRGATPIEPIPEIKALAKFKYPEDVVRRNPFKPPIVNDVRSDVEAPDQDRPKYPLEAFPLDSLKFVGVLELGSVTWGLIKQKTGLVSRVKPGDYMGKHYGEILKISNEEITIEETVQVGGRWEKKTVIMEMHNSRGD